MRRDFTYDPPKDGPACVFTDDSILIASKPPGLLSVPGRDPAHRDCVLARLEARRSPVLLVHRLDMDTSGLMVFARTKSAQRHLGRQFEARTVTKTYVAVVHGQLKEHAGRINFPLRVDWPNRPLQMVDPELGKPASTRWEVAAQGPHMTRVHLYPETGRSHQLRVHMAAIGHPIVGDRFYGPPGDPAPRLMLHAQSLGFAHPETEHAVHFGEPPEF